MPKPAHSRDARRGRAYRSGWLTGYYPYRDRPDAIEVELATYELEYDAMGDVAREHADRSIEKGRIAGAKARAEGRPDA
jgi:hypothetical protein